MIKRLVDRFLGNNSAVHQLVARKLAEHDPVQRGQALLAEGLAQQRAGEFAAAVRLYAQVLALFDTPDDPDPAQATLTATVYLARGIACRATGRDEQMLADYTAALRRLGDVPAIPGYDAYALRANARVKTGQMRSGEVDYQRFGMVFDPACPILLPADLYDHDRAIADCTYALEWQPDCAMARLCRGWLRDLQGDPAGAARDYEQALRFLPEDIAQEERERFRQLYEDTLHRGRTTRLNKREWMAPGYEYCMIGVTPGDGIRIDFRSGQKVQTVANQRPLHVLRELITAEGWRYMASEYDNGNEAHYYRRALVDDEAED